MRSCPKRHSRVEIKKARRHTRDIGPLKKPDGPGGRMSHGGWLREVVHHEARTDVSFVVSVIAMLWERQLMALNRQGVAAVAYLAFAGASDSSGTKEERHRARTRFAPEILPPDTMTATAVTPNVARAES